MLDTITGYNARRVIDSLRTHLSLSPEESLAIWGPVKANQHDSKGALIQEYTIVLLHRLQGTWLKLCQVTDVVNGNRWTRPPYSLKMSEPEAQSWLATHNFKLRVPLHAGVSY